MKDEHDEQNKNGPDQKQSVESANAQLDQSHNEGSGLENEELSEDELDSILKEKDAIFFENLSKIAQDKSLTLNESDLNEDQLAFFAEVDQWKNSHGLKKFFYILLPFLPRISLGFKKTHFKIKAFAIGTWIRLKNIYYYLITQGRKELLHRLLEYRDLIQNRISEFQTRFRKFSLRLKIIFTSLISLTVIFFLVLYLFISHKIVFHENFLFITSLDTVANSVFPYDSQWDMEYFYDNIRASQNMIFIPKMVVNIKASLNSGPNPMAAFDLFVEGFSPDVILEIKDREDEFKDVIARQAETFSFDQLENPDGKKSVLNFFLRELNRRLTTGKIKNIYFKTIILKP